ncbi:MAG TPA: PaaI family thioesterase [Acidimicrobiales bacterium]|jgi:uncharacterized protein (TIGR00369 family)
MTALAERFAPLPADKVALWEGFGNWDTVYFPQLVGLRVEEVRTDYCRMRLPYRPELDQPAGVVHGGAIATLIDTVVVPAIAAVYDERPRMLTISMNVQFLGAVVAQDAVAEGWVEQRGRSIVFCRAEVRSEDGRPCANGTLVYKVSAAR